MFNFGFGEKPLLNMVEGIFNSLHNLKKMFSSLACPLVIRKAEEFFLPPPFRQDPIDVFFASIAELVPLKRSLERSPARSPERSPERPLKRPAETRGGGGKRRKPAPKPLPPKPPSAGRTVVRTRRGGKEGEMHLRLKEASEMADVLGAIEEKEYSFLESYDFLVAHKVSKFSSASYLILLAQHKETHCALPLYPITLSREHDSFGPTLDACLEKLWSKHPSLKSGGGLKIDRSILTL